VAGLWQVAADPGYWEKVQERERGSWSCGFPILGRMHWGGHSSWVPSAPPWPHGAWWEQEAGAEVLLCFNLDVWAELFTEDKGENSVRFIRLMESEVYLSG